MNVLDDSYINSSGKVVLNSFRLEFEIIKHCNLNCAYCDHLSPWRNGITPMKTIIKWFKTWNAKIVVPEIHILGGEPLLHPQLNSILMNARKIWRFSKISLVTNGISLNQISNSLFPILEKYNINLIISKHFDNETSNEMIKEIVQNISNYSIEYRIRNSFKNWFRPYNISLKGLPVINDVKISNPLLSFKNCLSAYCCMINNNKLYYCTSLCIGNDLIECGVIETKKRFAYYKPLTKKSSANEIIDHFKENPHEQCSYCPETLSFMTPSTLKDLLSSH